MNHRAEKVILVDEHDRMIRPEEKLLTHETGLLHRAASVCVVDKCGSLLLQRRAAGKYHSANLWSNTCCGHPRPGERTSVAAHRRLMQEMGFDCELDHAGTFRYWARVGPGLIEHEVDHLYIGRCTVEARPDPEEVSGIAWVAERELQEWRERAPSDFTPWFFLVLDNLSFARGRRPE